MAETSQLPSARPLRSAEVVPFSAQSHPNASLVVGLVNKEASAVARLIELHSAAVRRVLMCTLGSERDVDDLVQDSFLTVLDRIETLRNPDRYPTGSYAGVATKLNAH